AKEATRVFVETGRIETFEESVAAGVSANLCDALVAIGQDATITVAIAWSRVRPPAVQPGPVTIDRSEIPTLATASEYLKRLAPEPDFQLIGWVIDLHRKTSEETGDVTIYGRTEAGFRNVRVALGPNDYDVAISAHRDKRVVSCLGTLVRESRTYRR